MSESMVTIRLQRADAVGLQNVLIFASSLHSNAAADRVEKALAEALEQEPESPWVIAPDGKSAGRIYWAQGQTQALVVRELSWRGMYRAAIHRNAIPAGSDETRSCICSGRVNADTLEQAMAQADAVIRDMQKEQPE